VLEDDPGGVDFELPPSMDIDIDIEGDTLLDSEGHRECRIH
jgi:hypothetical protein